MYFFAGSPFKYIDFAFYLCPYKCNGSKCLQIIELKDFAICMQLALEAFAIAGRLGQICACSLEQACRLQSQPPW